MADLSRIERELEADRAAFRASLTSVGGKLTPRRLVNAATSVAAGSGQYALIRAGAVARQNKGPLALLGAALSWMAMRAAIEGTGVAAGQLPRASFAKGSTATTGGSSLASPLTPEFDARIASADRAAPGRFGTETFEGEIDMTTHSPTDTESVKNRAYAAVADLRTRIEDGLDGLPDEAKARVRKAREAAIEAQEGLQARAASAARAARQTAQDNPLLIGILAFAAGAAIAAALPRTSVENRTIGSHRDRLFDEADRVLREETSKLKRQAEVAVAKGQEKAKDVIASTAEKAGEAVESASPSTETGPEATVARAS